MTSSNALVRGFNPADTANAMQALANAQNPMWQFTRAMFDNPFARFMAPHFAGTMAGMAALGERMTRDYKDPGFKIPGLREEVTLSFPFCDLVHFAHDDGKVRRPMLVVAPMSGHYASLLRDTIKGLSQDHDVYVTNWRCASRVSPDHGAFTLDTYTTYLLHMFRYFEGNVHTMGISQSGVPLLAAIALQSAVNPRFAPKSMTLMASPIDVTRNPRRMNKLAEQHSLNWYRNNVISMSASGRDVYPGNLQLMGLNSLDPMHLQSKSRDLFNAAARNDTAAVQRHDADNDDFSAVMDLDAAFYLQTMQTVFLDHDLPNGKMVHTDTQGLRTPVVPAQIKKTALFTIEGKIDPIVGNDQTHAAHDLCSSIPSSKRDRHTIDGADHYFFRGAPWHALLPRISAFTASHDAVQKRDHIQLVAPQLAPAK